MRAVINGYPILSCPHDQPAKTYNFFMLNFRDERVLMKLDRQVLQQMKKGFCSHLQQLQLAGTETFFSHTYHIYVRGTLTPRAKTPARSGFRVEQRRTHAPTLERFFRTMFQLFQIRRIELTFEKKLFSVYLEVFVILEYGVSFLFQFLYFGI